MNNKSSDQTKQLGHQRPKIARLLPTLYRESYTIIPDSVLLSDKIPAHLKLTYFTILSFAWGKTTCFPSMKTLAKLIGVDRRTIRRNVREIEELGLVEVEVRYGRPSRFKIKDKAFPEVDRTSMSYPLKESSEQLQDVDRTPESYPIEKEGKKIGHSMQGVGHSCPGGRTSMAALPLVKNNNRRIIKESLSNKEKEENPSQTTPEEASGSGTKQDAGEWLTVKPINDGGNHAGSSAVSADAKLTAPITIPQASNYQEFMKAVEELKNKPVSHKWLFWYNLVHCSEFVLTGQLEQAINEAIEIFGKEAVFRAIFKLIYDEWLYNHKRPDLILRKKDGDFDFLSRIIGISGDDADWAKSNEKKIESSLSRFESDSNLHTNQVKVWITKELGWWDPYNSYTNTLNRDNPGVFRE